MSGSYRYFEDGKTYIVTYTADENGYHPMFRIAVASPLLPPPTVKSKKFKLKKIGGAALVSLAGGGLG